MNLIERTLGFLQERRNRILDGKINSIPSPFNRFSNDFIGVEMGKMYIVTASTKASKTQLSSFMFIYTPLLYAFEHQDQVSIKIFYFAREETPEDVTIRFISFLLNKYSRIRISPLDLKSSRNDFPVKQEYLDLLDTSPYKEILEFFNTNVIFCSPENPTGCYYTCKKYAEDNGIVHKKRITIKDELGYNKEVESFDYYEANNPNEYRIIFDDHNALVPTEKGLTLKQSMDKLSEYHVILRNKYKFTIVDIIQQAFAGESLDAFKANKLTPSIQNIGDSKYGARNCDVALGIFSPFRYELKEWMKYDITKFRDNIRFLEVLANRGGVMGGICPLFFDGATCNFYELPLPNDPQIERVYQYVNSIRNRFSTNLFIVSNKLNKQFANLKLKSYFCSLFQKSRS